MNDHILISSPGSFRCLLPDAGAIPRPRDSRQRIGKAEYEEIDRHCKREQQHQEDEKVRQEAANDVAIDQQHAFGTQFLIKRLYTTTSMVSNNAFPDQRTIIPGMATPLRIMWSPLEMSSTSAIEGTKAQI